MDPTTGLELDYLCMAAEFAVGLLLISLAWRPRAHVEDTTSPEVTVVDWAPLENACAHALCSTGRLLSVQPTPFDQSRLKDLQSAPPQTWRDRLTGILNASGMDRIILEWGRDSDPRMYPSCYILVSLADHDALLESHGAMALEAAIAQIGTVLTEAMSDRAVISRYQPHRFLVHRFGSMLEEAQSSIQPVCEQIAAPEFFTHHDEQLPLRLVVQYWECVQSVDPETLLQRLEDSVGTGSVVGNEPVVTDVPATKVEAKVEERPFSINDLAPFPSPWDTDDEDEPTAPAPAESSPAEGNETPKQVETPSTDITAESSTDTPNETTEAPSAIEGYATAEDIASLFQELQKQKSNPTPSNASSSTTPVGDAPLVDMPAAAPSSIDPSDDPSDQRPRSAIEETTADTMAEDSGSSSQDVAERVEQISETLTAIDVPMMPKTSTDTIEDANADAKTAASKKQEVDMPPPSVTSVPSKSVYTDDIEGALLQSDLASLFATVRSSASGDFAHVPDSTVSVAPEKDTQDPISGSQASQTSR